MLAIVLSFVFIGLAAVCNSLMDKPMHHWDKSIFSKIKKNKEWWYSPDSWKNKYVDRDSTKGRVKWLWGLINKPVQLTDSWHFFKMWMIIFICLAISMQSNVIHPAVDWIFYGLLWNGSFSLLYNVILKKRK